MGYPVDLYDLRQSIRGFAGPIQKYIFPVWKGGVGRGRPPSPVGRHRVSAIGPLAESAEE